ARLPVLEQVAEALVRLLRRPEPRELPHRPQPAPVHGLVRAAREREGPRVAELAPVVDLDVLGGVQRLVLDPGDGRVQLLALARGGHRLIVRGAMKAENDPRALSGP